MDYLLLTGCTGLLGRYLLRDLLVAGWPVAVLVRANRMADPCQRVESMMTYWEERLGRSLPRPVVIQGDLNDFGLGLKDTDRDWLKRRCCSVLHSAASMTFREDKRGEPFRTNLDGTRALLDVMRELGILQLHHVSTAFICGLRQGRVLETEQDVGQPLGNVYEQSKLAAEKAVCQSDWLQRVTVYRPSSIVGDSQTGYVTSYHGFYLPLHLAYVIADKIPAGMMDERFLSQLGLSGHEGKNLVPVDWVAKAIAYLVTHCEHHGQTYHIASPKPVCVQQIQDIVREAVEHFSGRATDVRASREELDAYQDSFRNTMEIYRSHWRDDPIFDLTNSNRALLHVPCPTLNRDVLLRIARYPVERGFSAHLDVPTPLAAAELRDRIDSLRQAGSPGPRNCYGLQINGAGGGQWQLNVDEERSIACDPGLPSPAAASVYLNSETAGRILSRAMTVDQAIGAGRIMLEGEQEEMERVMGVLSEILQPR